MTEGYHPRAVAMVGAFGPAVRRASIAGLVVGVVAGIAVGLLVPATVNGLLAMALVVAVTVLAGTAVAILAVPPGVRRAYEAFGWLGHRELARFKATTASPIPVGFEAVRDWLAANPWSPVTGEARVELLVAIGQFGQARAEFAALAPPASDEQRLARASLRTWGELVETGEVDLPAFDAVAAALPPGSGPATEAVVVRALAVTRMAILREDPDPLRALREARPALGREATSVALRDTWLPFARSMAAFGLATGSILTIARFGWPS